MLFHLSCVRSMVADVCGHSSAQSHRPHVSHGTFCSSCHVVDILLGSAAYNFQVLAVGSTYSSLTSSSYGSADRYNPTTGTWAATGPLVEGSSGAWSAVLLPSGLVLAVGYRFSEAELYNPLTDTWTTIGPSRRHLPQALHLVCQGCV